MDAQPADRTGNRLDTFVTVVTVIDQATADSTSVLREVHESLSARYANYEIVVVDNGADGEVVADVRTVLADLSCIRVLRLSRVTTSDTATFAGLEAAIGDFVVVLSPVTDPATVISDMVDLLRGGHDIVQGISSERVGGSPLRQGARSLFYAYNRRLLGIAIPDRATALTGFTRRAVNSLTATSRSHRYVRHLTQHIGYRIHHYTYSPTERPSRRRPWRADINEAVEMVSSYSTQPLRVVTATGVVAGLLNLIYACYVVIVNLFFLDVAEGWTTTSLQLSLMFFIICIILAVLSEYIARILRETRREPAYFVMEEIESETLIADSERRNVST